MGVSLKRLAFGALLFACSCAPLTYSDDGAVDYQTYSRVRVTVAASNTGSDAANYLVSELQATSGFATVTLDPAVPVDAVLTVTLTVVYSPTTDAQGHTADRYDGTADYTLTAGSSRVDSGSDTGTGSNDIDAAESALDGVIEHYVAPYRL